MFSLPLLYDDDIYSQSRKSQIQVNSIPIDDRNEIEPIVKDMLQFLEAKPYDVSDSIEDYVKRSILAIEFILQKQESDAFKNIMSAFSSSQIRNFITENVPRDLSDKSKGRIYLLLALNEKTTLLQSMKENIPKQMRAPGSTWATIFESIRMFSSRNIFVNSPIQGQYNNYKKKIQSKVFQEIKTNDPSDYHYKTNRKSLYLKPYWNTNPKVSVKTPLSKMARSASQKLIPKKQAHACDFAFDPTFIDWNADFPEDIQHIVTETWDDFKSSFSDNIVRSTNDCHFKSDSSIISCLSKNDISDTDIYFCEALDDNLISRSPLTPEQLKGLEPQKSIENSIDPLNEMSMFNKMHYSICYKGCDKVMPLNNSEIYFFNEFRNSVLQHLYTQERRDHFLKENSRGVSKKSVKAEKICQECFKSFSWWTNSKQFCHFCLDYVCQTCLGGHQMVIPHKVQTNFDISRYPVCRNAAKFLNQFCYFKIEINNAIVAQDKIIFDFMRLRRRTHKLYDLLKCSQTTYDDDLFDHFGFKEEKHLCLKECFLTSAQLEAVRNGSLHQRLQLLNNILLNHIDSCQECKYTPRYCEICKKVGKKNKIYEYDVDKTGRCPKCMKLAHLKCIGKSHICRRS